MNTLKKIVVLLLIILSLSAPKIVSAHICYYNIKDGVSFAYVDNGDHNEHEKITYDIYKCSCGDSIRTVSHSTNLSHVFTSYSYTGYNYHSGTKHTFEYARYCSYCSHRDSYTSTVSSSGPPCVIPYSFIEY